MSIGILLTQPSAGTGGGSSTLQLYSENPVLPSTPVASGVNSISIGSAAVSTAENSIALGNQSYARHLGALVFANGRFASTGDSQSGEYLLRTITINNTPTELFLDGTGGSVRLTLSDDCTWTFRVTVTAHRVDGSGHAGYYIDGVIFRQAGAATTSFLGSPVKTVLAESDPAYDINISADTTNGALKITATGKTAQQIRWLARVATLEVTN